MLNSNNTLGRKKEISCKGISVQWQEEWTEEGLRTAEFVRVRRMFAGKGKEEKIGEDKKREIK